MARTKKPPDGPQREPRPDARTETLALLLSLGRSQKAAGAAVGITDRQVRNRLKDPKFQALIMEYRDQRVSQAIGGLVKLLPACPKALADIISDKTVHAAVRLQAIGLVLTHAIKLREHGDLSREARELEEATRALEPSADA